MEQPGSPPGRLPDGASRILARRAHFIGASLTVFGCSPATPQGGTTVAILPRDPGDAAPGPSASVSDPDAGAAPKDAGIVITDPQFKIPDGVSQETLLRYQRLSERIKAFNDHHAKMTETLAKGPSNWRDFAGELDGLQSQVGWYGYYCPNPPRPETDQFLKIVEDQRKASSVKVDALRKATEAKLGKNGKAELERYSREYDMANPRPCLSIACDRW